MSFISIVLIALTGIIISYFILNRRCSKTINILPGPKAFPLIGSAHYFLWRSSDEILDIVIQLTKKYSSPFKFWMANNLFIGVYEFNQMQIILQNSEDRVYNFIEPIFGKGLLTAPVSTWSKNRKMIAPFFNTNALRKFFDVFVEQSLILTDQLEQLELNRNKIIPFNHILKYALRTACGTMTNIETESLSNQIDQCLEICASLKKTFTLRVQNIFLYPNFIFNLTAVGRKQQKCVNFLHSFTNKIIQQHMYALNVQNTNVKYVTTHKTFLDILIEISQKDKNPQKMIHDNLITMLLAGADTTAATINFVIFMLANFPEIQEKAYKELWEIYEAKTSRSAPIKYEDLQHMNYLDCVIKETLRLFPTAPIIGRYLTKDVKMGELTLPKGTSIILGILSMHRNEMHWSNPLVFDPDRFLPEKIVTSKHYMPFGYGIRNCIGSRHAMISMKVILAILIRTFVFKVENSIPIDKIKLNMNISLCTIEPIEVIIEKRDLH